MVVAGKAGNHHQKRMILGGPLALQTSHLAGKITDILCLIQMHSHAQT
jgi:hypothetical protein